MHLNVTPYPFAGLPVTSPEARRLGELHAEAEQRVAAVREVRAQAAAALAAVGQASEALTEGLAREAAGEKVDTAKLTKALRDAEARAGEPWAQRLDAAERVAGRAIAAYAQFAREDPQIAAALHAEALPHAYADQTAIVQAFEALAAAVENHHRHGQRMTALEILCGHVPRELLPVWSQPPSVKQLREQARRVPCVFPAMYAPTPEPAADEVAA